jgi:transposase
VRIIVSARQEANYAYVPPLMAGLSVKVLLADRGYDVNHVVDTAHLRCHLIENVFRWLNQYRGIATRYAKRSDSFLAALYLRFIFLPFDDTL